MRDNAMDAAAFFLRQVGEREVAHLRMDGVDTAIKIEERRLYQFVARLAPVLGQLRRNSIANMCVAPCLIGCAAVARPRAFQAHNVACRCQRLRGHKHDNLFVAERQLERGKV